MTQLSQATLSLLREKRVLILGVGLTGLSCARFLMKHNISFAVNDSREQPLAEPVEFKRNYPQTQLSVGCWDEKLIAQAEIILASPGVDLTEPVIAKAISANCLIWGDVELYCRLTSTPILAVTGSNGKSTVVSLLTYLGKALGHQTELGGNIGVPVLDHLTENVDDDDINTAKIATQNIEILVLELSSFQLETLKSMKAIAATVLNVSDDHLDRHLTMKNYQAIKQGIYLQSATAIFNRDDSATYLMPDLMAELNAKSGQTNEKTKVLSFGSDKPEQGHFGIALIEQQNYLMFGEQPLIAINDLPLAGIHNALNYLAVLALGYSAGWSLTAMVDNLSGFIGLAHRCQKIESADNIVWINDSKATNVGATLAAITGFSKIMQPTEKLILIAGGEGKGADFTPLQAAISAHVNHVITIGKDGNKIASLCQNSIQASSLEQAVVEARKIARSQDVVLLSPACASLDMFKNFAQRGQVFIDAVQEFKAVS